MEAASLAASVASCVVAVAALVVAYSALQRADRNSSAATMVTLNEGFRHAWKRFLAETDTDERDYEFAELLNLFEIACALHQDGSFHGASKDLIEGYLCHSLSLIADNADARRRVIEAREAPSTFKWLRLFLRKMARSGRVQPVATLFSGETL